MPRRSKARTARRPGYALLPHRVSWGAMRELQISHQGGMPIPVASRATPFLIADGQKMDMFRLAASGDRTGEPTSIKDVVSLSARATEVFGSREKAMRSLETEVPSLDNRTPLSLITSAEGMAEVEDVLGAIEHGTW